MLHQNDARREQKESFSDFIMAMIPEVIMAINDTKSSPLEKIMKIGKMILEYLVTKNN